MRAVDLVPHSRVSDLTVISLFRRKNEKQLKDIYRQMIQLAISLGVAEELDKQITNEMATLETNDVLDEHASMMEMIDEIEADYQSKTEAIRASAKTHRSFDKNYLFFALSCLDGCQGITPTRFDHASH